MKTMIRGATRFATPLKLSAVAVAAILAACSSSDSPPPELSATIRTTSYGVPHVVADRDRLIQVVINLLSNAVKFVTPGEGEVIVRLVAEAERLRVEVQDNGLGISAADQKVIFEKFRQGGDTMTNKPAGTGLGLPISRQIIEYLGGRLGVASELGKGATFSFTLPLGTPASETVQVVRAAAAG